MTVTPDQAHQWAQEATDGPWYVHTDPDDPDGTYIYNDPGHMCVAIEPLGSDYRPADLDLIAAAPDLAQTIAGLRWEYAVEDLNGDILDLNDDAYSDVETLWTWHRTVAEETQATHGGTVVRRLGGPVEVVAE